MQNAYTAYFERLQGADLQKSTAYAARFNAHSQ